MLLGAVNFVAYRWVVEFRLWCLRENTWKELGRMLILEQSFFSRWLKFLRNWTWFGNYLIYNLTFFYAVWKKKTKTSFHTFLEEIFISNKKGKVTSVSRSLQLDHKKYIHFGKIKKVTNLCQFSFRLHKHYIYIFFYFNINAPIASMAAVCPMLLKLSGNL